MIRSAQGLIRCCLLLLASGLISGCLGAGGAALGSASFERTLNGANGRLQVRSQSGSGASQVELLGPSGEQPSATFNLPGDVTWLGWHPSNDLLIVTTELKRYSFGANYKVQLYRWSGWTPPSSLLLTETTLKPLTLARWETRLLELSAPVLGPQGDVLAFLRLHDPPAFDPYLRVVLTSLEGEGERVLGDQAMPGTPISFSADGETVRWAAGDGQTAEIHPWLGASGLKDSMGKVDGRVDPALLQMRQLLLKGLLEQDDYRQQWQKRRAP